MGVLKSIRNNREKQIAKLRSLGILVGEIKNLKHRKNEWGPCKLSNQEIQKVNEYWKANYGKKVPLYWHRLYKSYTGVFDEKYFPEYLFSTKLEEKLNPYNTALPLQNKAFCPQQLFSHMECDGIEVPQLYIFNSRGVFFDKKGTVVEKNQACELIRNAGEVIIKPTIDTMGAKGVRLLNIANGVDLRKNEGVEQIFDSYGKDFIIQKKVINHESIRRLYPDAVNTLRVITFFAEGGIQVAPLSMRIGMGGRVVDNGGIFIGVSSEGLLNKEGFSKYGIIRYQKHPDTGIIFSGYKIEGVSEMINAAKLCHSMIPQLKMLSWDLAYNDSGKVTIIEVNTTGQSVWFPQMVTGQSVFGEYTPEMLGYIK